MIQKTTSDRTKEISKNSFPERKFDSENLKSLISLLFEEGGELAGAVRTYFGRKYRPELVSGNIDDVKGEIGDILVILDGICNLFGCTMDECLNMTNNKLQERYDQNLRRISSSTSV